MNKSLLLLTLACLASLTQADRCRQPGDVVCDDTCENIVLCMDDPNSNGYIQEVIEQCPVDRYCYAQVRACVDVNVCDEAQRPTFVCTSSSVFPDPYSCSKFHICTLVTAPDEYDDYVETCEEGYAYNPERKICTYKIDEAAGYPRVCSESPVPQCKAVGQNGPLVENPSIYYICRSQDILLFPVLYECPRGDTYVANLGCVENSTSYMQGV